MYIFTKSSSNMTSFAYNSLVHPFLQNGAVCRDLYRKGQVIALDQAQKRAAKFTNHMRQSRKPWRSTERYLTYGPSSRTGELAWKAIVGQVTRPMPP